MEAKKWGEPKEFHVQLKKLLSSSLPYSSIDDTQWEKNEKKKIRVDSVDSLLLLLSVVYYDV